MRAWVRAHRWLCGCLAAVLLFAQLASQAHACGLTGPQGGHDTAALAGLVAAEADACPGHAAAPADAGQALLCKAHCQADGQSVNSASGALDVPAADGLAVALWPVLSVAETAHTAPRPEALAVGPPDGTPPLYLSLQVLRN